MENANEIREMFGLKDEETESELYEKAYYLYETGNYKDASFLFRTLFGINPKKPEYGIGLAGCFHLLHQYQSALTIYNLVCIVDSKNPLILYHMADCHMMLEESGMAIAALESAIKRMGDKEEYSTLKETSRLMIAGLKKKEGLL